MKKRIKVITLREPWASLVAHNVKKIETRSWYTSYRGEIYIHAGKYPVSKSDERIKRLSAMIADKYLYGNIVAKCILKDCILIDEEFRDKVIKDDFRNYDAGDYTLGRYAWVLRDIQPIEPIPATGHLSIWNHEIDV